MAATAIYSDVCRINEGGGTPGEHYRVSNSDKVDTVFPLSGGRYGVTVHASTYGTVTLQILAADASTWLPAVTAFGADGVAVADLPPGSYRIHAA